MNHEAIYADLGSDLEVVVRPHLHTIHLLILFFFLFCRIESGVHDFCNSSVHAS